LFLSLVLKDAEADMRTYKVLLHGMGAGAAIWCLNIDSMVETGRIVRTAVHYGALIARNAMHSDTTGGVRAPNPMFERDEAKEMALRLLLGGYRYVAQSGFL
jgi:hypothetical protein